MEAVTRAGAGIDFVEEFATAAEWYADHLGRLGHAGPRAPVPGCPGWSVQDLTTHLGNVHSWAATIVETGKPARELDDTPPSGRARRLSQWYLAKAEDLYRVLRETPPDRPCWNFAQGEGVALFWHRRQVHETLLHGLDLAAAADLPERMPLPLAVDAVDEVLTVFLHRMHQRGHAAALDRPLSVVATDAGVGWLVEPAPRTDIPAQPSPSDDRSRPRAERPAPRVVRGERFGTDLVEAPAAVLVKVLWKRARPTHPSVHVSGDAERVMRFLGSRLTP